MSLKLIVPDFISDYFKDIGGPFVDVDMFCINVLH